MATIVLSAAGAAIGSGFGGTVLGLSGAVIGRAVGATVGQVIDRGIAQSLGGHGSAPVETGRVDRFHLMGASEGTPIPRVHGRVRVGGQVIWATRFKESVSASAASGGGKGSAPVASQTQSYSYSVSLAIALCEGEIMGLGRVWADGVEIAPGSLPMRVYTGAEDQLPDAKIEAVEGAGMAPAYRGTAYVVLEDLQLAPFGNRVPQLSFEVIRAAQGPATDDAPELSQAVGAVAMIPGTGEYALATTPVYYSAAPGVNSSANMNTPAGMTDLQVSLDALGRELPGCGSVSLVVSWFGGDLRCGQCKVRPKVEQTEHDGQGMPWRAGGIVRAQAQTVPQVDGGPVYGGTPADASVIEAVRALRAAGQEVMFYPFVLMDQVAGNGLTDPWTGAGDQPALPWRGRITLDVAPGRDGSPDGTAEAEAQVAAFFGAAGPGDFSVVDGNVQYTGPDDWGYRRFVLHYAQLLKLAGGVDAFCVGSELRGLTRIRGGDGGYPAVEALRALTADVRAILGPEVQLSYAADWTEYGSYVTPAGDLDFPLDPLWADDAIDFVGIDNYAPISDWRDGTDHADAGWGSIYDLDYLKSNIAGGEYFDWFYETDDARALQRRTPIIDGAYGEPWVWRVKDLSGWWSNGHHPRTGGVRSDAATPWVPRSKPIRFTEYGCAAIDKGSNQPNKFLDPKSSESAVPYFSRGTRDDYIQMQYLRAMAAYWRDAANNPASDLYDGRMVDFAHAHAWAWDARPFPAFPGNTTLWTDGDNYAHGHWLTGRAANQRLARVVAEICAEAGVTDCDAARLHGVVRGYTRDRVESARAGLQPLILAFGVEAAEREGTVRFSIRDGVSSLALTRGGLAVPSDQGPTIEVMRAAEAQTAGRVRVTFVQAEADFEATVADAVFPGDGTQSVSQSELPLAMTAAEGRRVAERWLAEARVARDTAHFALPPSGLALGAGDVVSLPDAGGDFRIDRVEQTGALTIEATRVEPGIYVPSDAVETRAVPKPFLAPVPVFPLFMDLPLLTGDEVPWEPRLAVTGTPWPGSVAVYSAASDAGYQLNTLVSAPSVVGVTQTPLRAAAPGVWDRGAALRVKLSSGALSSAAQLDVLNGANVAVIGDGSAANWEVFQFADAVLVAPDTYDLTLRLRGQAGSDAIMPDAWPAGSMFVLLNGAAPQVAVAAAERGLARHYRIGPAALGYDDPSYLHEIAAFDGIGLRPLAPCHLRVARAPDGAIGLTWVRRTRIDGDSWQSVEVPLAEAREAYRLRVVHAGTVLREETVSAPAWTYSAAAQASDAPGFPYTIEVAQLSDSFGPGLARTVEIDA